MGPAKGRDGTERNGTENGWRRARDFGRESVRTNQDGVKRGRRSTSVQVISKHSTKGRTVILYLQNGQLGRPNHVPCKLPPRDRNWKGVSV